MLVFPEENIAPSGFGVLGIVPLADGIGMGKNIRRLLIKDELWLLYGGNCHYCGVAFDNKNTKLRCTLDHKIPVIKGGKDTLENCVLACQWCNGVKSNASYTDFVLFMMFIELQGLDPAKHKPSGLRLGKLIRKFNRFIGRELHPRTAVIA